MNSLCAQMLSDMSRMIFEMNGIAEHVTYHYTLLDKH